MLVGEDNELMLFRFLFFFFLIENNVSIIFLELSEQFAEK